VYFVTKMLLDRWNVKNVGLDYVKLVKKQFIKYFDLFIRKFGCNFMQYWKISTSFIHEIMNIYKLNF